VGWSKLSDELKTTIVNSQVNNLTVKDLNRLLEEKIFDDDAQGDPLPFKVCPQGGSSELERSGGEYSGRIYFHIGCKKCDWATCSE